MCAMHLGHLIGVFQEMYGKCLELDNWNVFQMKLCVACLIVLTIKRLSSTKTTIRSANYALNCVDSSTKHVLSIFETIFSLIYAHRSNYFMHYMSIFIENII